MALLMVRHSQMTYNPNHRVALVMMDTCKMMMMVIVACLFVC